MISAAKIVNNPLLADVFGLSRIYEISRRLREAGLFGAASTKVSCTEAARLLYVLCASRTVSQAGIVIDRMGDIRDRFGSAFIDDLAAVLENDELITTIEEISISQETGLTAVVLTDKTVNLYIEKNTKEPECNCFFTIRGSFLRKFTNVIKQKSIYFNQN